MASILPPVPRFVFTVFEPLSLVAGFLGVMADPAWFVAEQVASSPTQSLSGNVKIVTLQLGNIYLLLAMCAVAVLYSTSDPKVVRNYVIALWVADIGHLLVTYHVLQFDRFVDVAGWNAMAWGNIGTTFLLCLTRTAYLLGLFGPDRTVKRKKSSAKKSR